MNDDDPKLARVPENHRMQKIAESRKAVIHSALKTICGFLNAEGGALLIGVHDSGTIIGIEPDFKLLTKQNADGFELKVRSMLRERMNPEPVGHVRMSFLTSEERRTVCRVDVIPDSSNQYFLDDCLYVRDGCNTLELRGRSVADWLARRRR